MNSITIPKKFLNETWKKDIIIEGTASDTAHLPKAKLEYVSTLQSSFLYCFRFFTFITIPFKIMSKAYRFFFPLEPTVEDVISHINLLCKNEHQKLDAIDFKIIQLQNTIIKNHKIKKIDNNILSQSIRLKNKRNNIQNIILNLESKIDALEQGVSNKDIYSSMKDVNKTLKRIGVDIEDVRETQEEIIDISQDTHELSTLLAEETSSSPSITDIDLQAELNSILGNTCESSINPEPTSNFNLPQVPIHKHNIQTNNASIALKKKLSIV